MSENILEVYQRKKIKKTRPFFNQDFNGPNPVC